MSENITGAGLGDIPLPSFVRIRDDGLWVDISALDSPDLLVRFVDRVFQAQACFDGLDYPVFLRLLFDSQPKDVDAMLQDFERRGAEPWMRLAKRVIAFPATRQALYRGLAMKGERVEYFFEQVTLDREEDGQTISEVATLNFDEFVAAVWLKGLRYGLDEATIRQKLAEAKSERLTVAAPRPPSDGCDASVGESAKTMQRNDAPRLRHDGKVDLARYENRFPQVTEGQRLFRKLPSLAGVPGRDVQGRELPPAPVKDFSIHDLAGPGTRVEKVEGEGEYVVATMDGFLTIDADTGKVSVNDKIINRAGVSTRTTGDLSLAGQQYEEHGEVQDKRQVDGHDMTFFADVYGHVVSDGGLITLKRALVGGSAKSPGGRIVAEASASRATFEAKGGEVEIKNAESCLIVAQKVRIEQAVMCEIVADEISIVRAEGCALAGKSIAIQTALHRRNEPTLVTVLLPDLSRFETQAKELLAKRQEIAAAEPIKREQLSALSAEPDMKTYLSVQPRLRAKELTLTADQEANWQRLLNKLAPKLKEFARLNGELQEIKKRTGEIAERLNQIKSERAAAIASLRCLIDDVAGETLVRMRQTRFEDPPFINLPAKELHQRLRETGTPEERLFFGESGLLVWPPPQDETAEGAEAL